MSYVAEALDLIEITCFGIQTGHHVNMALFYEKYETALLDTLITMVSNNFESLERTADGDRAAIVVHGWLVDDKFALVPNVNAVVGALAKAMEDTLGTLHSVPRWLRTTNVRCPVVLLRTADDDEWLPPYSFHDPALLRCERVVNAEKRCYDAIERIGDRLDGLVRRFEKFHFLIKRKDQPATDLFAATGGVPTLDDYADKLRFFAGLSAELRGQSYLDLGCVRVDYSEFNDQLIEWCEFWHSAYGHRLLSECDDMMTTFANNITTLTMELNTRFNNCQGLDMVEKAIKKTKETVFQADSVFQDVHKRFYFLKRHGITVPDRQWRQLDDLQRAWRNVHEEALTKSFCIEDAKTGLLEMVT